MTEKPKPLDLNLERLVEEWSKREYWITRDEPDLEAMAEHVIKRIKSACEFYLRYKDKPGLLIKECPELIKKFVKEHDLMEVFFAKEDILEIKVVDGSIIAFLKDRTGLSFSKKEYNDWLFKLAFGLREDER